MSKWECLQLHDFLAKYPELRLKAFNSEEVIIEGEYELNAQIDGFNSIKNDLYHLRIIFKAGYPKVLPIVHEVNNRIPRNPNHHTYDNGSFCLGSDINLKLILSKYSSLEGFVDKILVPFLYNISYKMKYNFYPYGDLAHGEDGLVDDYKSLFQVRDKTKVLLVLDALGRRKRVANKLPCACGCGKRLGKCNFRFNLYKWRRLDKRRWYKEHHSQFSSINKIKK